MEDVKIDTSKTLTLTLPSDPTSNAVSVSLYHEFGNLVTGPTAATRISAGVYTITYGQQASGHYVFNSAGRHRADFTYTVSGTSYTKSQYINVYTPYITADTFFEDHPELEDDWYDKFDKMEKKVRNIINTFCGQSFERYLDKSFVISGTNKKTLHLPYPVVTLTKVTMNVGEDDEAILFDSSDPSYTSIQKSKEPHNFGSSYYIEYRRSTLDSVQTIITTAKFRSDDFFTIEGDFGWQFVPNNIEQAADLLLEDMMNDDSEFRRHGISRVDMDTIEYEMRRDSSFYESTGNIDADVLLMDYTLFIMDYVV